MLEEPNVVDMIMAGADGGLQLVVTDAGITTGADERLAALMTKLQTYLRYIMADSFAKEHPGVDRGQVRILVVCQAPPTADMLQITEVHSVSDPALAIPVQFRVFPG